jgi:hypothetical protein
MVGLGALQCAATPFLFKTLEEPTLWFFAGGILLALVGAMNTLRLRYGQNAVGVVWVCVIANLLVSGLWVTMALLLAYKFRRYPAAYAALIIILATTVLSVRSLWVGLQWTLKAQKV